MNINKKIKKLFQEIKLLFKLCIKRNEWGKKCVKQDNFDLKYLEKCVGSL